jgi:GDPmannose 4,6-dehydratase
VRVNFKGAKEMKKALISGACGQDGYYLSRYLLSLGYEVWGGARHIRQDLPIRWVHMDLCRQDTIQAAIRKVDPAEIYNLGAQSFVPPSWCRPDATFDTNVSGLARILELVADINPRVRVYQASSSEMFGNVDGFSDETTRMAPTSPYGISKLAAHELCRVYRQKGVFAVSGICFNHESPERGPEMVTRKITQKVAQWVAGDKTPLKLGSLSPYRDWGFSGDYVQAMHAMLQQDAPDDYVIGTGEAHTVQEFLDLACKIAGVTPHIEIDPRFLRAGEIKVHRANAAKAQKAFGFKPSVSFQELVALMVNTDIVREHHAMENAHKLVQHMSGVSTSL